METTLTAENGRTLRLGEVTRGGDGLVESYVATLTMPGGSVTTTVHEHGTELPRFFRGLADSWRGWDGVKSFRSLEAELSVDARHDGRGTVSCSVAVGQPWPPEWSSAAELDFGAGAHLEAAADELELLFR